ncbi:hypothetical protein VTL71DRAFT_13172 [Oculimacula yallundae]|uniref:Uncharacterized protein n=1 Tax=Oculimacula yallundae TaxID=86028 RepID=A0ABR4CQ63_9HELO
MRNDDLLHIVRNTTLWHTIARAPVGESGVSMFFTGEKAIQESGGPQATSSSPRPVTIIPGLRRAKRLISEQSCS